MARTGYGADRAANFRRGPDTLRSAPGASDRRLLSMVTLPPTLGQLTEQYGPHLHDTPPGGWQGRGEPDRLVKTHCCFCGVQCGIQLKVKDNTVIGFEPWEEFPVNRGMLCPKGVKRYLQGSHPRSEERRVGKECR